MMIWNFKLFSGPSTLYGVTPGNLKRWMMIIIANLIISLFITSRSLAAPLPEAVKSVYIPSHLYSDRKVTELIHYAKLAKINAVVLHVKDPHGRINWKSKTQMAANAGAIACNGTLKKAVDRFKAEGIWTIAKLDVFADHQLIEKHPEMGILNSETGKPWVDKNGLYWANPYDCDVWDYNIALSKELVSYGVDEIQFDYIRFPCDGDLKKIYYPIEQEGLSKAQCISQFLETAYSELKPLGATISIDIFGIAAWRKDDFGVGQVLEKIAPYVDVVCPMLYPSHFSKDFQALSVSGNYPRDIMELSVRRMQKRTDKRIRPWIQGFWYPAQKINDQIDGILNTGASSWAVWNPSGNYSKTYAALARRLDAVFPTPQFYPSVDEMVSRDNRVAKGNFRVVNLTNYKEGFTILSLEESKKGLKSAYSTPTSVVCTMDEGIIDQILTQREIPFSKWTSRRYKNNLITKLISSDLNINPRHLRAMPIYIDWCNNSLFTRSFPLEHLDLYENSLAL